MLSPKTAHVKVKLKGTRNKNNEIAYGIGIVEDVSEQFETIQKLKFTRQRLNMFYNIMNSTQKLTQIGGWEWNISEQKMHWTDEVYRIHGIDNETDNLNKNHIEESIKCYLIEDRETIANAFKNCVEKGQNYEFEFEFIDKKNQRKWIRTGAEAVYENNQIVSVLGYITDISKQKMYELELKAAKDKAEENHRFFRSIFEQSPILFWEEDFSEVKSYLNSWAQKGVTDFETFFIEHPEEIIFCAQMSRIIDVNQAVISTLQFSSKDELLHSLPNLLTQKSIDDFSKALINIAKNIHHFEYITEQKTFKGEIKHFYIKSFIPHEYITDFSRVIVAMVDITEQIEHEKELLEAKEKAEESDELKSAFLKNISHEVRTPMNAIIGFSDIIAYQELDAESRLTFTHYMQQATRKLLNIIDSILTISQLETGQLKLFKIEFKISKLCNELITEQNQNKIEKRKTNIEIKSVAIKQDFSLETDYTRLYQILTILFDNALKFSTKGQIEFSYFITESEICFVVKDNGIGFHEDKKEIVLKTFSQINNQSRILFGGLGLGLSICAGLVSLMNGRISIKSKPELGTEVTVCFPNSIIVDKSVIPQPMSETTENKKYTFLVAEDESMNYIFIHEVLNCWGIADIHATNGLKAIELFKSQHVDLILMDLKMPDVDGFEALKEIRKLNATIPVIGQTAFSFERELCIDAGFTDYIAKPFTNTQLLTILKKYIDIPL